MLVHGASGAVGLAAVQLARAAGLTVIGTAGSEAGLDLVLTEGAHHAVDHRDPQHGEKVTALTGGRGPDVIIEMLANVNLDLDLAILAPRGRVVIVGNRGRIEIDPRRIMAKDAAVHGMAFWNQTDAEFAEAYEAVDAALASGALNPVVGQELPLAAAAEAHQRVMSPGARGKIVLAHCVAESATPEIRLRWQSAETAPTSVPGQLLVDDGFEDRDRLRAGHLAAVDVERRRGLHAHLGTQLEILFARWRRACPNRGTGRRRPDRAPPPWHGPSARGPAAAAGWRTAGRAAPSICPDRRRSARLRRPWAPAGGWAAGSP